MYIYIYLHTYIYACICTQKHMRMHDTVHTLILILVAFISGNSSLEPLIEGLYAQIHVNLR